MLKLLLLIMILALTGCAEPEEDKIARLEQQNKALLQQLAMQGNQQLQTPVYTPQQAPVVVEKDSSMSSLLLGGLVGHAIGSNNNSNYQQPKTIVNRTYISTPNKPNFNTNLLQKEPKRETTSYKRPISKIRLSSRKRK